MKVGGWPPRTIFLLECLAGGGWCAPRRRGLHRPRPREGADWESVTLTLHLENFDDALLSGTRSDDSDIYGNRALDDGVPCEREGTFVLSKR